MIALPLALELILLVGLALLLTQSAMTAKRIDHYRAIIARVNNLQAQFLRAGNLVVFYSISHKKALLQKFHELAADIDTDLSELTDESDRSKKHQKGLRRVCALGNEAVELLDNTSMQVSEPGWFGAMANTKLPDKLLSITGDFFSASHDLVDELQRTERLSPKDSEKMIELQYKFLAAGVAVCVVFIVLSFMFYKHITQRLFVLIDNTRRFADGEKLHPPLSGSDEIFLLDQVFHKMSSSLEEAAEFRKQIISTVSHELRTPLTALKMFLTLLGNSAFGELPAKVVDRSNLAEKQVDRLIRLLNDLLAAESIRSKGFSISLKKTDIAQLAKEAINSVNDIASKSKITIMSEVDSMELQADPDRILQVFVNLMSNAVKFSPEGEKIVIKSELQDKFILLKVIDAGRGVPEEKQEAIFQRHVQVSESDKKIQGGMGLGLAICKAIVEQHGGQIGCYSNEERGSTFWFTLPISAESFESASLS